MQTPSQNYNFSKIEQYWQNLWYQQNIYKAIDNSTKPKKYILVEFPFPSGASLHVGHCFRYTAPDVYSRFWRMKGYNVLFPMGWDSFGLPTEERARKEGKNPKETTKENLTSMKTNLIRMGYGFDWAREFATTDPSYYKWTQWIFGEFYKAGLAKQKQVELWWCPKLSTVLSNEEVIEGVDGQKLSERGEHPVYKKNMKQWVLKMPAYAEKLLDGLEQTSFPKHIKDMQKNWIGKSEGTVVKWNLGKDTNFKAQAFEDFEENRQELRQAFEEASLAGKQIAVSVTLTDAEGRFLTLKRSRWDTAGGRWDLPGGSAENRASTDFENLYSEARRELLEESGIEVANLKYSSFYDTDLGEFNQPEKKFRWFIFFAKSQQTPILSDEHEDYRFINLNEAKDYLSWQDQRKALFKLIAKIYPLFVQDDLKDNLKNTLLESLDIRLRERAVGLVRIRGQADKFVAYLKPSNHQFHFLGGGTLEPGENARQAAEREILEELGIANLKYVSDLGVCQKLLEYKKQPSYNLEHYFLFECSLEDFKNRCPNEAEQNKGEVVLISEQNLRQNGWAQLNKILDNLEALDSQRIPILLATHNQSKAKRYLDYINHPDIKLITAKDIRAVVPEPQENGQDEIQNAKIKAKAYFEATGKICLSQDTGLYFEDLPAGYTQPQKNVQGIAGVTTRDSQEVRFQKISKYYTSLAKKLGGQVLGYFKDIYCIYDGQKYYLEEGIRRILMVDKTHLKKDIFFPLCSFYKDYKTKKYYHDLTADQMQGFLEPSLQRLKSLLAKYAKSQKQLSLETFTTRVDTLPSVSFLAVAPENDLVKYITTAEQKPKVQKYLSQVKNKSERDRQIGKQKTGCFSGSYAKNPINGQKVPIWIADYVLAGYGSGAVMGVAGHDQRDLEFAQEFDLEIKTNVKPSDQDDQSPTKKQIFTGEGILYNSGNFNGMSTKEARQKITAFLSLHNQGYPKTNYKFRDWVFSRQRYWGEPFPFTYLKVDTQQYLAQKNHIKYIILDFDGVLADTLEAFAKVFQPTLAKDKTLEQVKQFLKDSTQTAVDTQNITFKQFEGKLKDSSQGDIKNSAKDSIDSVKDKDQQASKLDIFKQVSRAVMQHSIHLFHGFIEELSQLDNVKMAVVSSSSEILVKPYCQKTGLDFTHILGIESGFSKVQKIQAVAKDWGVCLDQLNFFTDTISDVRELWNTLDNSKIFGCSWGWHGYQKLREALPKEQILNSFADIHTVLQGQDYTQIDQDFYQIKLLPEAELPLELPSLEDYEPSEEGLSPLSKSPWIHIKNQKGEVVAKRESDTMPNWAGSSWYYLRYVDPQNTQELADQDKMKYWLPVDYYFGGSEHTTLHLLYSRFWHRFLFDRGVVPTPEPYQNRTNGGILLAEDGTKMSKSKGNVVNPEQKINTMGSDALRLYINFIGPYEATVCWQEGGLRACKKLVDTVFHLKDKVVPLASIDNKTNTAYHKFVKNVGWQIESLKTNVAVAEIMTMTNFLKSTQQIPLQIWLGFLKCLAPFAPHLSEELWYLANKFDRQDATKSIHLSPWPQFDPQMILEEVITIAVQVNGKLRGTFEIEVDASEQMLYTKAQEVAQKYLLDKDIKFKKIIPNKMVTFSVN